MSTTHILERKQIVPAPLDEVFHFFEDPKNLERITPSWLHFNVKSTTHERVQEGTEIQYRLRWQVFPMSWRSRITEYRQDEMFADEMLRGPYTRWYHRHFFEAVPEGVEMIDRVEYTLPFGPLGDLVHTLVIRRQLESIFDYRQLAIRTIFPA
ncbi:MAG: SRPBCC family protein [Gemmatimonadota bacterium]